MKTEKQQQIAAVAFAKKWGGAKVTKKVRARPFG